MLNPWSAPRMDHRQTGATIVLYVKSRAFIVAQSILGRIVGLPARRGFGIASRREN